MCVKGVVRSTLKIRWDGTAKEKGYDVIWLGVCSTLVVCEKDECSFHKLLIEEERTEEGLRPGCGILETRVVPIIQHIWG